jgi:hypothetical protein
MMSRDMTAKPAAGKSAASVVPQEPWPPHHLAALRRLVEVEGLTSGQVAKHPDLENRYSRAAIMGRSRRLGLKWAREGFGGRPKPPPPPPPPPEPVQKWDRRRVEDDPAIMPEEIAQIFRLRAGQCRYPVSGEGLDIVYCAEPVVHDASSWCALHRTVCYVPPRSHGRAA